ncbi:hypothetical protein [Coleofasciculus sp.]|uniref:hypothetical protein n=1 Tax=Coleofasciculus sp. TaxID=3100458 RepID=UPI0039F8350B
MWDKESFAANIRTNWQNIVKTKPKNYDKKIRAIYRTVEKIPKLSTNFQIKEDDEINVNIEYAWFFYEIGSRNSLGSLIIGPETIRQRQYILSSFGISAYKPYLATVDNQKKSEECRACRYKSWWSTF